MSELTSLLSSLKASKKERVQALKFVQKKHINYTELFDLAFNPKALREHIYAAWVWELLILDDLSKIKFYWSSLLDKIDCITHQSMRRVHSKIIWHYVSKKENFICLLENEKKKLIEVFLDWVMTETKTAPLSYSIKILSLFFEEFPELKQDLGGLLLHSKKIIPKGLHPTIRSVFKD